MAETMFTTFKLGDQELRNRIIMSPLTRARATGDMPNDIMVEYYRQRASAGLIITEATGISEEGHGWKNAPMIATKEQAQEWKKVTDAVHEKNGKIFSQLWHMGRQSHSSFHPLTNDIVSASAIKISTGSARDANGKHAEWETPRALSVEQVKSTVQDYVSSARRAKDAGFDGVELHGGNGYLIDQFLQSCSNQRNDEYGGSFENRTRFLKEIIEAIIADGTFPASCVGVKLSPNGTYGDMGSEDNDKMFPFVAKELEPYGLAYLHVMDGLGFGFHNKCKPVTCLEMKMAFKGPIMANVGLTKEMAEGILRTGAADLVCFGRLYISNPDLVERFKNNWPLNPDAVYEDWWTSSKGASGYIDFPFHQEVTVESN